MMIRRNPGGHVTTEKDGASMERIIIIRKMVRMSSRLRTSGYQSITTKIIAMVALFAIIVAFSVVLVMRANESISETEYIWLKVEPNEAGLDVTGDVYIYDDNNSLLEHFLLLNTTGWQHGELRYDVPTYIRVYVTFWYLEDKVSNVMYLVGRSPIVVTLDNIKLTIISDWEEPTF
jgi:hypothetical protein